MSFHVAPVQSKARLNPCGWRALLCVALCSIAVTGFLLPESVTAAPLASQSQASQLQIIGVVYFDAGKASVNKRYNSQLQYTVSYLKSNPQQRVLVRGYADQSERTAEVIAKRRAEALRNALLAKGIHSTRIALDTPRLQKAKRAKDQVANRKATLFLLE